MGNIKINEKLHKDIITYCKLNELNINDFCNYLLQKSFSLEKYGEQPFDNQENIDSIIKDDTIPIVKPIENKIIKKRRL